MSRRSIFSKENTFWAFLGQVIDADGGCKEVVRKLQSYASVKGGRISSSTTASYCTARKKLDQQSLTSIFQHTAVLGDKSTQTGLLYNRRVIVVDGTGLSMPDTHENQEAWPQSSLQKPVCGFPSARVCACFSMESGSLLSYEIGNKKNHELPLLRKQWKTFKAGDIFLGDKGFCSYYDTAKLKEKGVDSVITLARRKPVGKSKCLKFLGPNDLLIKWDRPKYTPQLSYSRETMAELPKELTLRQIRVVVDNPGFRTKEFHIVTTLLDSVRYLSDEIASLYLKRWDVELFFRDIKITMGMDILRCQTPELIRKELVMHFIAYNCIRRLMYEAAEKADLPVRKLSFKGILQAIRSWSPQINREELSRVEMNKLLNDLHEALADSPLKQRPGRSEPRCRKRRPKAYQLLTKPRHKMNQITHRDNYVAKALN
ncbi:IS4 family transposase [Desulfosediminicola flagellatus]|uniref:IS4 family transposase n=1 Tax=Desulfosediminicola flagellatus TaxID=2569541 RepID=UPI001C3D833B|nr:IS4 family transposase [Desulfosediminicola flagellatus]